MRTSIASKTLALAFAVCLISMVPSVVMAEGDGQGGPDVGQRSAASDSGQGQGQQWTDQSGFLNGHDDDQGQGPEMEREMVKESTRLRFFGQFNLTGGVVDGRFITFALNETSGALSDYALKKDGGAVTVFDSIRILGFEGQNLSLHGSVMRLRGDGLQMIVHDNPTGMYHVVSGLNVTVAFLLAEGMSAVPLPSDNEQEVKNAVSIFGEGLEGIVATDDGAISIDEADAGTFVNVTFSNDHVMFRVHPLHSHLHIHEGALIQAISQGRVAGEMSVILREGLASYDTMEYMSQFQMRLKAVERNRIQLQLESQEHAGKVVVVNFDQGTLDPTRGEVGVELDGVRLRCTANPLEVLYAEGSQPSDAVYCMVSSEDTSQFLIYVPSFSVHELTIASIGPLDALTSGAGLMALAGALALVALAGVALIRRKR